MGVAGSYVSDIAKTIVAIVAISFHDQVYVSCRIYCVGYLKLAWTEREVPWNPLNPPLLYLTHYARLVVFQKL